MKIFLRVSIPFGVLMGAFQFFQFGLLASIMGGIFSGSVFGLVMTLFMKMNQNHFEKVENELTQGEKILYSAGANHSIHLESVGGWLMLTPTRLIFTSHEWNIHKHKLEIQLRNIGKINPQKSFNIFVNKLNVIENDGTKNKFVVNNSKEWMKQLSF